MPLENCSVKRPTQSRKERWHRHISPGHSWPDEKRRWRTLAFHASPVVYAAGPTPLAGF